MVVASYLPLSCCAAAVTAVARVVKVVARCGWMVVLPLLALFAGCATTHVAKSAVDAAPTGIPERTNAMWNPNVVWGTDPFRHGASTPGLVGRVYLWGPGGEPILCDGQMQVMLYEEHPPLYPDGSPKPLEVWNINADVLKTYAHREMIGWGYTLALPWQTYRPGMGEVHMQVVFKPEKSLMPLYENVKVVLQNNGGNNGSVGTQTASSYVPGFTTPSNGNAQQPNIVQISNTEQAMPPNH